jgi:hypothetical protein
MKLNYLLLLLVSVCTSHMYAMEEPTQPTLINYEVRIYNTRFDGDGQPLIIEDAHVHHYNFKYSATGVDDLQAQLNNDGISSNTYLFSGPNQNSVVCLFPTPAKSPSITVDVLNEQVATFITTAKRNRSYTVEERKRAAKALDKLVGLSPSTPSGDATSLLGQIDSRIALFIGSSVLLTAGVSFLIYTLCTRSRTDIHETDTLADTRDTIVT